MQHKCERHSPEQRILKGRKEITDISTFVGASRNTFNWVNNILDEVVLNLKFDKCVCVCVSATRLWQFENYIFRLRQLTT